ncbi:type II toxin-antitoxin system VapC family toxin [Candidatus Woesearchaeota archaeon]|nr:type II toxin-antitoxin system VapC family toxin [Candidatus Woesearchaeota archaeon]
MKQRFYIDSSIWMDIYEDRRGYSGEPLALYGLRLLELILAKRETLIITDTLIDELSFYYSPEQLNGMLSPFHGLTEKIMASAKQKEEAERLASERSVPRGDTLHAVISRDHNLILVTRDRHFRKLEDVSSHHTPEELI